MRAKPILTGLLSYIPGAYARFNAGPNMASPEISYGIGFKHLCLQADQGAVFPASIAEIGPGASLGAGVLALLLGAERYVALDVVPFARVGMEAAGWSEAMAALLAGHTPLPNAKGFPELSAYLDADGFPAMVDAAMLDVALDPERIRAVGACLACLRVNRPARADGLSIEYRVPWDSHCEDLRFSMNAVFSHTVMQHVPDPGQAYRRMAEMLRPDGFMSHQINYGCHGMASAWNGHWAYPDWLWRIAMGRKPFLINRKSHGEHLQMMRDAGFEVRKVFSLAREDGLPAGRLAPRFRVLGEDLRIAGAVIVACRAGAAS